MTPPEPPPTPPKTPSPVPAQGQASSHVPAQALHIVSPAYTLTACFFAVAVVALIVGSFMVRLPIIVEGQGMLMADTEVVSYAILPESDGRLEEFFVAVGETVTKGQVIARVSNPRLENEIETADRALRDLQNKDRSLAVFHKDSLAPAKETIIQQRVEANSRELSLRQRLARVDRAREGDTDLIKKGFLSARGADTVNTEREQVEDQLFISKRQMMEAETSFSELSQRQQRERLDLSLQINTQQRQLQALEERRKIEAVIISPYDGIVADLLVDLHQPIVRERRVATLTPLSHAVTGKNAVTSAVVFVPSIEGKRISVGMPAQLLPLFYEEQQFGRIEAVVSHVSTATADEDALLRLFKNQKLVRKMFENDAPYKVLVTVKNDPRGMSGLAWTSSRGPERLIEPGTIVSGWIAYDRPRVLYLMLPAVRRLSESAFINALELFEANMLNNRADNKVDKK